MERALVHGVDVFLTVAREGSMRAAAARLGVGASAVSLQIKALEERLGVDLLHRTTRKLALTEAGQILFDSASPAFRDLAGAVEKARQRARSAHQTLRLTLSRGAYLAAIGPMLTRYLADHPAVSVDFSWNEELVDIERKGFHAGVRLGDMLAPDMAAVRASTQVRSAFFASPQYLRARGRPHTPSDLLQHACIRHRHPTFGQLREWRVVENGQSKRIDPAARLVFDSAAGVIQAARDGHGVGWSMRATMADHIETGDLEEVLAGFAEDLPPFYLYFRKADAGVEPLASFIAALERQRASEQDG